MDLKEKINYIIDQMAEGAWQQHSTLYGVTSQCAFCYVDSDREHGEDCPVRIAQEVKTTLKKDK